MQETLLCLDASPQGLSSHQLGTALFGDDANISTIKATVSRLRNHIDIDGNPYRIAVPYRSQLRQLKIALERGFFREALERYPGPLLPGSEAPMVIDERNAIARSLREGIIGRGDPELMYAYVQKVPDDLEMWSALEVVLDEEDPRRGLAAARIETLLEGAAA